MNPIDLNCDLAEGTLESEIVRDCELMRYISSANLCGGAYAGSRRALERCVFAAREQGVAIGAHPGHADPAHFGRRPLPLSPSELHSLLAGQLEYLADMAEKANAQLQHVKLHGALYHQTAHDPTLAEQVIQTMTQFDPRLLLYAPAPSQLAIIAHQAGLHVVPEFFLDRQYTAQGDLVSRDRPAAFVSDPELAVGRLATLLQSGVVETIEGTWLPMRCETACFHSDHPQALAFAQVVHQQLQELGIPIRAPN